MSKLRQAGFTIVELLIVIVVIGILAAITIVAYNGVQNKANDTAVKADLTNFAKKLETVRIETLDGNYPSTLTQSMGFKASRGAYGADAQGMTFRYCRNASTNDYILYALSKSGNYFRYTPAGGLESAISTYGYGICSQIGLSSTNPSMNGFAYGAWGTWVN